MNGNGTWRSIAFGAVGLLTAASMALSGWALAEIASIDKELSENKRSVDDLWLWVRAEQVAGEKWHDAEKSYDVVTQDRIDRVNRDVVDELRRINDRMNAFGLIIGRRPPKSDIPP